MNDLSGDLLSIGAIEKMAGLLKTVQDAGDTSKNRFDKEKVSVERHGTKIILPAEPVPMRYNEAIESLQRIAQEEETQVSVYEEVSAFPLEGAYAFMKALKETYGWATPIPKEGFFGKQPPTTVNLEIDLGVHTQIIWGQFKIPGIEGVLETASTQKDGKLIFLIRGQIKKKSQAEVAHIAKRTRELVKEESIYRGKSIVFNTDSSGNLRVDTPPSFLDLSRVNPNELTFSDEVEAQVQTNLFTPIEYTAACRMHQIPLKRGVLLEGPFGTGKTLTAFVTAQKAKANGWTFILIDRVAGLDAALDFAREYQPAVVFAEDVDRAISGQERTVEIDDILNTIDGVESKGSEVITILTSNDAKSINKAMLRPGRLDAVISVQAPDDKAVQKLINLYARGLLEQDTDLTEVGRELSGSIPAVIREVVERSKLYAIGRARGGQIKLIGEDLLKAAKGMKHHLSLLAEKKLEGVTPEHKLGAAMADIVAVGVKSNGVWEKVQAIHEAVT